MKNIRFFFLSENFQFCVCMFFFFFFFFFVVKFSIYLNRRAFVMRTSMVKYYGVGIRIWIYTVQFLVRLRCLSAYLFTQSSLVLRSPHRWLKYVKVVLENKEHKRTKIGDPSCGNRAVKTGLKDPKENKKIKTALCSIDSVKSIGGRGMTLNQLYACADRLLFLLLVVHAEDNLCMTPQFYNHLKHTHAHLFFSFFFSFILFIFIHLTVYLFWIFLWCKIHFCRCHFNFIYRIFRLFNMKKKKKITY